MKNKKLIAALLLSSVLLLPANFAKADQIVNQDISGGTLENYSGNASGGAVLNEIGNTMSIDGATIQNNSSTTHGGAVYNEGTLTITNSTFSGNTSHAGGAVSTATGSSLTIGDGTTFNNNQTFATQGDAGGALYASDSTLIIEDNVKFYNNSAMSPIHDYPDGAQSKGAAGAAYIYNTGVKIGEGLEVSDNKSEYAAGGLYIWNNDGSKAEIGENARFENNSSNNSYGGAIGNFDGKLEIGEGATFSGNSAKGNGGAIANMNFSTADGANLTVGSGAQFINNKSEGSGGAIYNDSTITLDGATFSGNNAANGGGAIYNAIDSIANLNNVTVNAGTEGGAANDIFNAGKITTTGTNTFASNITNNGTIELGGENTISSAITGTGSVTNNGTLNVTESFSIENEFINNSKIQGDGKLTVSDGTNNGSIEQDEFTIESGATYNNGDTSTSPVTPGTIKTDRFTNNGTFNNNEGSSVTSGVLNNTDTISGDGSLVINNGGSNSGSIDQSSITVNGGTYTNTTTGSIVADTITNDNNSVITNNGTLETGTLTNTIDATINNNGTLTVTGSMTNNGTIINSGKFDSGTGSTMTNEGTFISSGANASMNATNITNNKIFGADNGAVLDLNTINNDKGTIQITNGSTLNLTAQTDNLGGSIVSTGIDNTLSANDVDIVNNLQVGDGNTTTSFTLANGNVVESAVINVTQNATLNIGNTAAASSAIFNDNATDTWSGGVNLVNGTLTLDNFKENASGTASYSQSGGDLYLNNNSSLSVGDSSLITGGNMFIDNSSSFHSQANGFILNEVKHSGMLAAMNSGREDYAINGDMIIGDAATGDNQADFTIDVHGRSNWASQHGTDHFNANNIVEDTGLSSATINIADWGLAGDIFGWDAPIDSHIQLENIFSGNISQNINLTSTNKEVFTPIGWYQLNNHGGIGGTYTLDLTRFNPQVYRGQVTTVAQWMNQLAIDDMLFNHSMVLPSFKDEDGGVAYSGMMANRYASTMPQFAPYQYSRKDGGLWYKMYGTFETLQMSQGLCNVGNNAYGALIGADFGLKELKHGWKFMPTAYIGYNGAHQYWAGMGAYQNGGQAGFLGTWYKDNFIIGGLVYGGIYDNSMDVAGRVDSTFNYFAGAATKAAYNWRFHRDWVLQPNLFLAYNFFGQQNWHSEFGQMGMMSGMLNGVNLAPGVNLIWEKETFSIYATLQYMYNLNGAVGGRAGNVGLPHIEMERGYIQYGLGFTKRFTDRFSGYLQAVFRNVGRTGVGFQMGFNILLGK